MANGRTHTFATMMIGAAGVTHLPVVEAVLFGMGAVTATILQPDLDQIDGKAGYFGFFVLSETHAGIEKIWKWYWMPYAKLFAHRSVFTHFPPIATPIRLLYAFWWTIPFHEYYSAPMIYFVMSIFLCDTLHWIMDWKIWKAFGIFRQ